MERFTKKRKDYLLNNEPIVYDKAQMTKRDWNTVLKMFRLPKKFEINKITIPAQRMACEVMLPDNSDLDLALVQSNDTIAELIEQGVIEDDIETVYNNAEPIEDIEKWRDKINGNSDQ